MLVLELDPGVRDQVHHGLVVHDDLAVAGAAEGHRPVVHDLGGQVVRPALGAEQVAALQAGGRGLGGRRVAVQGQARQP